MKKYYIDTEFIQGMRKPMPSLPKFGKFNAERYDLQLISVGLVCEDGREYYAISNEFDLDWAWNKSKEIVNMHYSPHADEGAYNPMYVKEFWLRDNVLKPIYDELHKKERVAREHYSSLIEPFGKRTMETLIRWNGKANIQIANEICEFIYGPSDSLCGESTLSESRKYEYNDKSLYPEFYGYYSDYDWVALSSLFEDMMTMPLTFPKYCRDLQQIFDELQARVNACGIKFPGTGNIGDLKNDASYPKQLNEHHALSDARWNKQLAQFLQEIKLPTNP